MADENETTEEEEGKGGGSSLFPIIIGVLLGAGLGGGGVFFGLSQGMAAQAGSEAEASADGEVQEEVAAFSERVLSLEPFVVNVSGEAYPRYVKLQVALELDSLAARAEAESRVAQIRDLTILLLSSKRLGDIDGFEGKALLKDDLRERVNGMLDEGKVSSVLFTEFVIQ